MSPTNTSRLESGFYAPPILESTIGAINALSMGRGYIAIVLVFLVILSGVQQTFAQVNIRLVDGNVQVRVIDSIQQNVSSVSSFSVSYVGSNSSIVAVPIQSAISALRPGALVEGLALNVTSNGTAINFSLIFNVSQVITTKDDITTVNLGWKSFAVGPDIKFGSESINKVGESYILPTVLDYMTRRPVPDVQFRAYLDGRGPRNIPDMQNGIKTIAFLDLSAFSTPVAGMKWTYSSTDDLTRVTSSVTQTNVTVVETDTIPNEQPENIGYIATFQNQLELSFIGPVSPVGDNVVIDRNTRLPVVMVSIVVGLAGVFAGSSLYERRITRVRPKSRSGSRR